MIAKVQGAKRKRNNDDDDEEDVEMGSDDDDDDDDDENGADKGKGWMDVDDDDESAPTMKRVKTNSGGVINKREPRSNRQMAGMRDEKASIFFFL